MVENVVLVGVDLAAINLTILCGGIKCTIFTASHIASV